MNPDDQELHGRLERLFSEYPAHPLLDEIEWLAGKYLQLERKLHKITRISDRLQTQILELNHSLNERSLTDPLTHVLNRRGMYERLQAEANRAAREHSQFGLILLDLDHFKQVNDSYGHQAGDQVLTSVATAFKRCIRSYDSCARWGGEEFLLLLPDCTQQELINTAEKLCTAVAALATASGSVTVTITLSAGAHLCAADEPLTDALAKADRALYAAKQNGRNQVLGYWQLPAANG